MNRTGPDRSEHTKIIERGEGMNNMSVKDSLPAMIVFDLDDCLWTPEMHELSGMPSVPVEGPLDPDDVAHSPLGTVGLSVPKRKSRGHGNRSETVRLYDGARRALRTLATDPAYRDIVLAVASSSLEPSYSRACLRSLEVVPGVTVRDMLTYDQIGRTGVLSSSKLTHFRELQKDSGVPYDEMLFYDDCNWGDHVGDLEALGVTGQRTPNGLQFEEFELGLEKYKARA